LKIVTLAFPRTMTKILVKAAAAKRRVWSKGLINHEIQLESPILLKLVGDGMKVIK